MSVKSRSALPWVCMLRIIDDHRSVGMRMMKVGIFEIGKIDQLDLRALHAVELDQVVLLTNRQTRPCVAGAATTAVQ